MFEIKPFLFIFFYDLNFVVFFLFVLWRGKRNRFRYGVKLYKPFPTNQIDLKSIRFARGISLSPPLTLNRSKISRKLNDERRS